MSTLVHERGEERARYEASCRARLPGQLVTATVLGSAMNFVLAVESYLGERARSAATLLTVGALFSLAMAALSLEAVRSRAVLLVYLLGAATAFGTATLAAEHGGFSSAAWAILVLSWGVGATQLSLPTRVVALGIAGQSIVATLVMWLSFGHPASAPGRPLLMLGLLVIGAGLAVVGSVRLHERDLTLFRQQQELETAQGRLRRAQRAVAKRNLELESRAQRQALELVSRARSVDQLEALIAERIQSRSMALLDEVDRISNIPATPLREGSRPSGVQTRYGLQVAEDELRERTMVLLPEAARAEFAKVLDDYARLDHPGVQAPERVTITPSGVDVVRKALRGTTLMSRLANARLDDAEVTAVMRQVAEALKAAHAAGLAHGALDPQRIWLREEGAVIEDFGLVAAFSRALPGRVNPALGTYLAPGSKTSDSAGPQPADDIYGLGAVAFQALAGVHPQAALARGESLEAMLAHVAPATAALVLAMVGPADARPSAAAVTERLRALPQRADEVAS